ncbi:hypothetical protein LTV02_04465 [Nocardia yamanashiensis]|uniref:hypothetical protein n=1 Tax=Nocardia yamanashiensis TaxID=209247 RepID=UPI001E4501C6|nr:hypothetical protein [Nocardia yamanashiensis]UGT42678.1 hypothetical protein LTV02_04465 [Nocardia yamanashiensis]
MTVEHERIARRRSRANTFAISATVVGLLVTLFTTLVSLIVMSNYSNFIFGGGDWHRITSGASKSIPAQACLWISWLFAGLTCVYLGSRAVTRARNFVWAIVIALILYEIGLDATIEIATRGIDAAYDHPGR